MQPEETQPSTHSDKADVKDDPKDCPQTERTIGRVWYKCARCHQAFDDKATLMTHTVSFCFVFHLVLKGSSKEIPKGIGKHDSSKANVGNETPRAHAVEQNGVESNDATERTVNISSQVKKIQREVKTPGICPICNKQLSNELLSRHIRIHTGELPYACSKCSLTFSQSCSLTRHLLTHKKGEKLLDCEQCDNRYRSVRDLNRHLKLHAVTGDVAKEFLRKCRVCSLEYRTKRGLREHEKTHGSLAEDCGSSDVDGTGRSATAEIVKKTASAEKLPPRRRKRRSTTVKSYAEETSSSSDEEYFDQKNKRDNRKRKKRRNCIESDSKSEPEEDLANKPGDKKSPNMENLRKEAEEDMEHDSLRDGRETGKSDAHVQSRKDNLLNSSVENNDNKKDGAVAKSTSNQIAVPDYRELPHNLLMEEPKKRYAQSDSKSIAPKSPAVDDNSTNLVYNTSKASTVDNHNSLVSTPRSHAGSSENTKTSNYPMVKCNVCSLSYKRTVQGYHDHVTVHHLSERIESHQPVTKNVAKDKLPLANELEEHGGRNKSKPDSKPQSRKKNKPESGNRQPAARDSSSEEEPYYESDVTSEPSTDASSLCMDSEFDSESTFHSDVESESTDQYGIDSPVEEVANDTFHNNRDATTGVENSHAVNCNRTGRMEVLHDDIVQDTAKFTSEVNVKNQLKMKFAKIVLVKLNLLEIEEFGWIVPKKEETDETWDNHDQLQSNFSEMPTVDDVEERKPDVMVLHRDGEAILCDENKTKDLQKTWSDFAHSHEDSVRDLCKPHVDSERFRGGRGLSGDLSATSSALQPQTPVGTLIKHESEADDHTNEISISSMPQSSGTTPDHSNAELSIHVGRNHDDILPSWWDLPMITQSVNERDDKNNNMQRHNFIPTDIAELSDRRPTYRPKTEPISDDEVDQNNGRERPYPVETGSVGAKNGRTGLQVKTEPLDEADSPNEELYRLPFFEVNTVELQKDRSSLQLKTDPVSDEEDIQNNFRQSFGFSKDCISGLGAFAKSKTDLDTRAKSHVGYLVSPLDSPPNQVMNMTASDFREGNGLLLDVSETFTAERTGQNMKLNLDQVTKQEERNDNPPSCFFQERPVTLNGNCNNKSSQQKLVNMTETQVLALQSVFPIQFN